MVLGCRVESTGELSATLERRASWALAAYRTGLGRVIVPAGGRRWHGHAEAERVASYLLSRGVPQQAIFPELCSLTTAENALFSRHVLERVDASRALLVTCHWHMPRALSAFRAVGVEAFALPVGAPPASLWALAHRLGHEVVAAALDRRYIARVRKSVPTHPFEAAP